MPCVLVIDDDTAIRKMLRFRLQDSCEVLDTASPKDGLMLALQRKPDVILADLMMPGHTGFEVCQTIAALSFTELIPVLVISGAPKTLYKDFCYTLGAKGYFEKPIDFDLLQGRILEILSNPRENHRIEQRIRLRLGIKLRGKDQTGNPFEILTSTDNVSRKGYCCSLDASMPQNTVVELFLWTRTAHRFVGQARLVWLDSPEAALTQRCGFRFIEEPREWIF
jgi:DNA-binding response OmpR family regulator